MKKRTILQNAQTLTGPSISLIKVGGYCSQIQKDYCIRRNILWLESRLINLILYFISVAIVDFLDVTKVNKVLKIVI